MKTNKKTPVKRFSDENLAGGFGMPAALQSNEAKLRRLVMACLLWEDNAYEDGVSIVEEIKKTIPLVSGEYCLDLAIRARTEQRLRHVPLLVIREMCRYDSHRKFVREAIKRVCTRPDQLSELLSLYWLDGKNAIPKQMKLGMSDAFNSYDEYQLAKWNKDADIKLRDVLFLSHAKPNSPEKEVLFKKLVDNQLATPDTWEVGLSAAKTNEEKVKVWTSLIEAKKLGELAVLRNLRNMIDHGVPKKLIRQAIRQCKGSMLLPIDFIKAADYAPDYLTDLEELMFKCLAQYPKLKGETVFVLDVSGSMQSKISSKSNYSRMEVGIALAMMAKEMCEGCTIYLTAGNDYAKVHKTSKVENLRGFGLMNKIREPIRGMGGGGIFTRQCMDYIRPLEDADRVIVFSDSQDCDSSKELPRPIAKKSYIVDVSSHKNGINYKGVWTAEISGWSEHFLRYIEEIENA